MVHSGNDKEKDSNCMLWLNDELNSTHYCDGLRLLVNKIVNCLTIGKVILYKNLWKMCQ